tara:strand:- start:42463 stop:43218 length:756 start_codon:yes stop_codon:yes gene_type:complete
MFWWAVTPKPKTPYLDEPLVFIGEEDELNKLEFVVVNDTPSGYQLSYSTLPKKVKKMATNTLNATGNYIINMTMADLMEGAGATVGSAAAGGAFVIILGTPTLLSLPAYFLMEGPTKSFGAFCGRKFSKHVLGPNAVKPALQAAFGTHTDTQSDKCEMTTEELIADFELLAITDEEKQQYALGDSIQKIMADFKPLDILDEETTKQQEQEQKNDIDKLIAEPIISHHMSAPLNIIHDYQPQKQQPKKNALK